MPELIEKDILGAELLSKSLKDEFILRLRGVSEEEFFDPVKRQKLATMEHVNKKAKLTTSQGKRRGPIRTIMVARSYSVWSIFLI